MTETIQDCQLSKEEICILLRAEIACQRTRMQTAQQEIEDTRKRLEKALRALERLGEV